MGWSMSTSCHGRTTEVGNQKIDAHNLCSFEGLPTNIQQDKDRQIDILEHSARKDQYSISFRTCDRAGGGLLLTRRDEIRAIEMPEYRYPANKNENNGPANDVTINL
jgi:hypothetical protein